MAVAVVYPEPAGWIDWELVELLPGYPADFRRFVARRGLPAKVGGPEADRELLAYLAV